MKGKKLLRRLTALGLTAWLLCGAALAADKLDAIPARYEAVRDFSEGLAAVRRDGLWGYLDEQGRTVIPFEYDWAWSFSEGLAVAAVKDGADYRWYAVDRENTRRPLTYPAYVEDAQGRPVLSQVPASIPCGDFDGETVPEAVYHNGYVNLAGCVALEAPMGLVFDRTGRWVELGGYYTDEPMGEGLFAAAMPPSAETLYIDRNGVPVLHFDDELEHILRPFHQGLAPHGVREAGGALRWGFIDRSGRWVIEPQYTDILVNEESGESQAFQEGLAVVRDDTGRWGAIDRSGRTAAPFRYERLGLFSEGLAAACLNGRWGAVDETGKTAVPFRYERITGFAGGVALALRDGETWCVDRHGEELQRIPAVQSVYFPADGALRLPPETLVAVERRGRCGFARLERPQSLPEAGETAAWAQEAVTAAIAHDLIPAGLRCRYEAPLTRRELAAVALRVLTAAGERLPAADPAAYPFSDTADSAVRTAAALGLVTGRAGGAFDPDAPVTRQETAAVLTRAGRYLGREAETAGAAFSDADAVEPYAREAVAYVSALGVMEGFPDGSFAPWGGCTRQQVCAAAWRLYQAVTALP